MVYLGTFNSLGRFHPEEIKTGEEEAIRADFAARVSDERKRADWAPSLKPSAGGGG